MSEAESRLDRALALPGVVAVFRYNDLGELEDQRIDHDSGLTTSMLDMVSHMCVANRSIASMQARGWEQMTGAQGFYPVEGFALIGFDWSVLCSRHYGVVTVNEGADYEAGFALLEELAGDD
jgi:roadblock/LC7 domain-containing protein